MPTVSNSSARGRSKTCATPQRPLTDEPGRTRAKRTRRISGYGTAPHAKVGPVPGFGPSSEPLPFIAAQRRVGGPASPQGCPWDRRPAEATQSESRVRLARAERPDSKEFLSILAAMTAQHSGGQAQAEATRKRSDRVSRPLSGAPPANGKRPRNRCAYFVLS
jgi:hypothetical protein